MEESKTNSRRLTRWSTLFFSLLTALILTLFVAQALAADGPDGQNDPASQATDAITGQAIISGTESAISPSNGVTETAVPTATVVPPPTPVLTGTVEVTTTGELTPTEGQTPTVEITVSDAYTVYFPIMRDDLRTPILSVVKPNSNNQWQLNWNNTGAGVSYQIQESQDSGFNSLLLDETIAGTSKDIQHDPSPYNTYYYRVRSVKGNLVSSWATVKVNGAYEDNFSNNSTGWAERRTSFKEKTDVKYGTGAEAGYLIAIVFDKWDWVVGSPLAEAPELPYVIEYRSRNHEASNLISGGIVVGGDWNGQACPDIGNIYETNHCFNQFYDFNYIFHGPLSLLFERVDRLYWCPGCGGSSLKRLGNINDSWPAYQVLSNAVGKDWHNYKVEVRASGLTLYIDGVKKGEFWDDNYVHRPYFGVFATTEEYQPSIWFYDYYKVTPLD